MAGTGSRIDRGRCHGRTLLGVVVATLLAMPASAAYLLEIDTDGADDGPVAYNTGFSFGNDTTTASSSATSAATGTTGGDSIFGGDGTAFPDTYLYTYAPDSQADNLVLAPGTDLGEGNLATGGVGGGPGVYAVYATWPLTSNVSGGLTEYQVVTAGDSFTVQVNQNDADDPSGTDGRGDVWVYLGNITYTSGDITVTQTPTGGNTFISQRAYGLLFERADAQPVGVPGLAGWGLLLLALSLAVLGARQLTSLPRPV